MATNQVISQWREKSLSGDFDTIFHLGPELRYTGALKASNNNNLEEELLIGVDKIVSKWYDSANKVHRQTIEFRRETDTIEYYLLEVYDYIGENASGINLSVSNGILTVDLEPNNFLDVSAENGVLAIDYNVDGSSSAADRLMQEYQLYFVQNSGLRVAVSTKQVWQKTENGVTTVREVITNSLT